jgi:transcription-repair coupling factor (superfamily II helicase)
MDSGFRRNDGADGMTDLARILRADRPLTLAGAPSGFLPWLLADMARAAKGRAVFIAADEAEMRAIGEAASYFAPEIEVLQFPAWDCLPYDRASPSLRSTSARLATLYALQRTGTKPQLLLTTIDAVTQRTLTPFRVRQLVASLAPGERIDRDRLAALLQANGYARSDTVADAGEYAVRGGIVDLFPAGEELALRLDFFGDEIESIRRFDPADQRTVDRVESFTLLPASEALLDEDSIQRFRARYVRSVRRERRPATRCIRRFRDGRRLAGMETLAAAVGGTGSATVFDHLSADGRHRACATQGSSRRGGAGASRRSTDYHGNRVSRACHREPGSYRPRSAPEALYLEQRPSGRRRSATARCTLAHALRASRMKRDGARPRRRRRRATSRPSARQQANVYEAVVARMSRRSTARGRRVVLASYSRKVRAGAAAGAAGGPWAGRGAAYRGDVAGGAGHLFSPPACGRGRGWARPIEAQCR